MYPKPEYVWSLIVQEKPLPRYWSYVVLWQLLANAVKLQARITKTASSAFFMVASRKPAI